MARTKGSCRVVRRTPTVKPIWPHERGQPRRTKARTTSKPQQPPTSVIRQRSCSFLNLPRELRDGIYSLLLPSYTTLNFAAPTRVDNAAGRFFDIQYDMSQYSLTVLGLCQQIRAEAIALLYGTNHFEFSVGDGSGPSPFNTIRALPQSGISQIKSCAFHVVIFPGLQKRLIRGWMDEICKLLMHGGKLQEIKVEVGLDHGNIADPPDLVKVEPLLKPLERLNGLKSAIVKGLVTEAYAAQLKRLMENDGTRKYKKRKAETAGEEEVVLRPKKKRSKEQD